MTKRERSKLLFGTSAVVIMCIAFNIAGDLLTDLYAIPAVLDSLGTIFAAYMIGPFSAACVGCSSALIMSLWNGRPAAYCIPGIVVGLFVGIAARRKKSNTIFDAVSTAGMLTIFMPIIYTLLNIIYYDCNIGNELGDGVKNFFVAYGLSVPFSLFIGQFYLEFTDKLFSVVSVFCLTRLFKKKESGSDKTEPDTGGGVSAVSKIAVLFLTLGVFLCVPDVQINASAMTNSYIRTVYNGYNGLSCGHANDVIQTNDGILWVGSYSGLYRYNGRTFRHMTEYDAVKNVNCLYADNEGRLWIGTNDNGVVLSVNERITGLADDHMGLPNNSVRTITQSSDGDYYIGTSDKLAVAKLSMGISITKTIDDILYANSSSADDNGNVAVSNAAGKLYILRNGEIAYEIAPPSEDEGFTCCRFAPDGVLYAGTADGRVITYNAEQDKAVKLDETVCDTLSGINCIYASDNDKVWVLADNGMGTIKDGNNFEHMETEGFNYSLEKMTADYQGNLWIASSRMGLMQLSSSPFTDVFAEYGLEQQVVNTTAIKNGLIYVGMDGGLAILDTEKKTAVENKLTKLFEDARVRCIITDSNGDLWICSYGKGLAEVKSDGRIVQFNDEKYGIGSRVRVCMELRDGTIAVGGDKGLYFIKDDKILDELIYGEDMGAAKVLCMYEYPDGTLLAGTDGNGIAILKNRKVTGSYTRENGLTSDVILRMVGDLDEGDVFVSTGNGLCYLKNSEITVLDNFPYSNNFDVILANKDVFVTGSAGVYVCKRSDLIEGRPLDCVILNSKTGLMGSLTSNAWNAIDYSKIVYLSTDRGVFSLNLNRYKIRRRYYRVMVSQVLLDGISYPGKNGTGLTIDNSVKSVELIPEVVNYTLEDPIISYCLENFDDEWKNVPQSELSHVVYTNLPAGKYEFRLAILDPETGESMEECSYTFEKKMAIYENSWFVAYLLLFGGLFIGWGSWFFTRGQLQKTIELQQAKLALALRQVQMGNETILAIAKTVDAKDVRTSRHSQRVSVYSVLIGKRCGFNEEELENLRKSALLHDIGKIGIPDAILNKPTKLTAEEYEIMKTHVVRGAEILKDFTLINNAIDGAKYHHERYDGKGYPDHLSGKEIPLFGRIIAIADAFDAMASNRVYRKCQDYDTVMSELKNGRGTQFDPELLDIFLDILNSKEIDLEELYRKNTGKGGDDSNEEIL